MIDTSYRKEGNVSLDDLGRLVAIVPRLLGFRPVDSLVAVGLQGYGQCAVVITVRTDIPTAADYQGFIARLVTSFVSNDVTGAALGRM